MTTVADACPLRDACRAVSSPSAFTPKFAIVAITAQVVHLCLASTSFTVLRPSPMKCLESANAPIAPWLGLTIASAAIDRGLAHAEESAARLGRRVVSARLLDTKASIAILE